MISGRCCCRQVPNMAASISRITALVSRLPSLGGRAYNIWCGCPPFEPTTRPIRRRWRGPLSEPPPADFIARIRGELNDTLARVREAAALPWKDLTAATLAELRFNSIAGWLPDDEANALRAAFQREINRLYLVAEADEGA